MIIKKIDEEITYFEKSEEHTFEINGKKVRVYTHDKQDNVFNNYEGDQDIDEDDAKKLTEEELEALEEDMMSNLDLKVGEEWETEMSMEDQEAVREAESSQETKKQINEAKHGK